MKVVALVFLTLLSFLVAPMLGESFVSPFSQDGMDALVFWQVRVPRVVLAGICGAALSLGGMVFQAVFRNALATPYTLGVASGATSAVAVWVSIGVPLSFAGVSGVSLAALLGALVSVVIVYQLARLIGGFGTVGLLLGGVILSFIFSALTMLAHLFNDANGLFQLIRWSMGNLGGANTEDVFGVLPFVCTGVFMISLYLRELDLLSLGDELALTRGVAVDKVRKLMFFAVSLMIAGVISITGPIGFVGVIVPHLSRMIVGAVHRQLFWCSLLLGAQFLVWCDTIARSVTTGSDIPVGIITALLGGPFFLVMLLRKSDRLRR